MNKDLEIIKENYGEKMMEFCEKNFVYPGALIDLMLKKFAPYNGLYDDICKINIEEFKSILFSDDNKNLEYLNYVISDDGKYHKYDRCINGYYFYKNNIRFEPSKNGVKKVEYDPETYLYFDNFTLNLKNKTIVPLGVVNNEDNATILEQIGIGDIETINITDDQENDNKIIKIITTDGNIIIIKLNELNEIIGYENNKIEQIGEEFLKFSYYLEELSLPSTKYFEDFTLKNNRSLSKLNAPNLEATGYEALKKNQNLVYLNVPNLKSMGNRFLEENNSLIQLNAPNLEEMGDHVLARNKVIEEVNLPKLRTAYYFDGFAGPLESAQNIRKLIMPLCHKFREKLISRNKYLRKLYNIQTEEDLREIEEKKSFIQKIRNSIGVKIIKIGTIIAKKPKDITIGEFVEEKLEEEETRKWRR